MKAAVTKFDAPVAGVCGSRGPSVIRSDDELQYGTASVDHDELMESAVAHDVAPIVPMLPPGVHEAVGSTDPEQLTDLSESR